MFQPKPKLQFALNVANVVGYGANATNNPDALETDGDMHAADNTISNPNQYSFLDYRITANNEPTRILTNSTITSWPTSKTENEDFVFDNYVGNSSHRDAVDTRLINDYNNNTGGFASSEDPSTFPGGWPTKNSTSRPVDYDTVSDGMADEWEFDRFGDLSQNNNGDDDSDGYTNLEAFLHSLIVNQLLILP